MKRIEIAYTINYTVYKTYEEDDFDPEELEELEEGELPDWVSEDCKEEIANYVEYEDGIDYKIEVDGEVIKDWN